MHLTGQKMTQCLPITAHLRTSGALTTASSPTTSSSPRRCTRSRATGSTSRQGSSRPTAGCGRSPGACAPSTRRGATPTPSTSTGRGCLNYDIIILKRIYQKQAGNSSSESAALCPKIDCSLNMFYKEGAAGDTETVYMFGGRTLFLHLDVGEGLYHGIMGRRFPDGGLLRYRK